MGELQDGDSMILGRDDLIAAFRLWCSDYLLEIETAEQVLARMQAAGKNKDLGTIMADQLIDYLIESAEEPMSDLP